MAKNPKQLLPSVVKFKVTSRVYDPLNPWNAPTLAHAIGSGFCIELGGEKIGFITTASVARGAAYTTISLPNNLGKANAKLLHIGHDTNLALFEVTDKPFLEKCSPLQLERKKTQSLKDLKEDLEKKKFLENPWADALGYYKDSAQLSTVNTDVARTYEFENPHSGVKLVQSQLSYRVSPEFSGGPVKNNKGNVMGVMQSDSSFLPITLLRRFIQACANETYHGFPDVPLKIQSLENPTLREHYGLEKNQTGVLIGSTLPQKHSAFKQLKYHDIILKINGVPIHNDGTYHNSNGKNLFYLFQQSQLNDTIRIQLLRDKKIICERITLQDPLNTTRIQNHEQFHQQADYYINSGMVFISLTQPLLEKLRSSQDPDHIEAAIQLDKIWSKSSYKREITLLSRFLDADITKGYPLEPLCAVLRVNDKKIFKMDQLIARMESNNSATHSIIIVPNQHVCVEKILPVQNRIIIRENKLVNDRSIRLRLLSEPSEKILKEAIDTKNPEILNQYPAQILRRFLTLQAEELTEESSESEFEFELDPAENKEEKEEKAEKREVHFERPIEIPPVIFLGPPAQPLPPPSPRSPVASP